MTYFPFVGLMLLALVFLASAATEQPRSHSVEWGLAGVTLMSAMAPLFCIGLKRWHRRRARFSVGSQIIEVGSADLRAPQLSHQHSAENLVQLEADPLEVGEGQSPEGRSTTADVLLFAVWMVSSTMTVFLFRWPNWLTQNIPLPVLNVTWEFWVCLPALGSWWWSYCIRAGYEGGASESAREWKSRCVSSYRAVPALLGFVMTPLAFAAAMRLAWPVASEWASWESSLVFYAGVSICVLLLPRLILNISFPKRKLAGGIARRLRCELEAERWGPFDLFVWETGGQDCNALCLTSWRGKRQVLLSDLLVRHFSTRELAAIARHELAHRERSHGSWRFLAMSIPWLILGGFHYSGAVNLLATSAQVGNFGAFWAPLGLALGLSAIVLLAVSRWCELDADRWSIRKRNGLMADSIDVAKADSLLDALSKLAVVFPEQFSRPVGGHPALSTRIQRIRRERQRELRPDIEAWMARANQL